VVPDGCRKVLPHHGHHVVRGRELLGVDEHLESEPLDEVRRIREILVAGTRMVVGPDPEMQHLNMPVR
jgi:hypothetical protein